MNYLNCRGLGWCAVASGPVEELRLSLNTLRARDCGVQWIREQSWDWSFPTWNVHQDKIADHTQCSGQLRLKIIFNCWGFFQSCLFQLFWYLSEDFLLLWDLFICLWPWLDSSHYSRCIHGLTWCWEVRFHTCLLLSKRNRLWFWITFCRLSSSGTLLSMDLFKNYFFPQTVICFVNVYPGILCQDKGRIGILP